MNAVVRGPRLGPEQEQAADEHQSKTDKGRRHDLLPDLRYGFIPERDTDKAKIKPAQHSHGERYSQEMCPFDNREYPHRFANAGSDFAFVEPLAKMRQCRSLPVRLVFDADRQTPN